MVEMVLSIMAMAFAIAIQFLIPSREVTQPPSRRHVVWEVLLPGTSPAWGYFGGLALVGWTYWISFLIVGTKTLGNAAVITDLATPNLVNGYGVPPGDWLFVWIAYRPNWILAFVVPPLLFAVNLVLVFRHKLFRKDV